MEVLNQGRTLTIVRIYIVSYEYQFERVLPRVLPPQAVDTIERNDRNQSLESIANKTKHQFILTHMWANEYENTIQIDMVECQVK